MAGKSTSHEHDENIYDYIPDYVQSPSASRAARNAGPAPVNALPIHAMALTSTMVEKTTVQNGTNNNLNHVSELLS